VPLIAIVDDDDSARRSLLRVVRSAGYAAEAFASARAFLEWLPQGRAACLLLDIHMNEMSGFELQERLAVPVIFITAGDDVETRARIASSGAIGHLLKPCSEQSVLDALRRAVQGRANPALDRTDGAASATPAPWPSVAHDRASGDPDPDLDPHREDGGEA